MKQHKKTREAFITLLYSLSPNEKTLLCLISDKAKERKVLRFEGKIEVTAEDYARFYREGATYAALSLAAGMLLDRKINLSSNDDWQYQPLVQEAGSCQKQSKVFISFNPAIIPYLPEIECTLNYDLEDSKSIQGAEPNRLYKILAAYLNKGVFKHPLKEFIANHYEDACTKDHGAITIENSIAVINSSNTRIKVDYKLEDNPSEEDNPLFIFSVVKRYD